MKYLVFETEQEAIEAEKQISLSMGFAKPGINAASGQLDNTAITERWAIPQQVQDGRWVFPSPDNTGIEAQDNWWPQNNNNNYNTLP